MWDTDNSKITAWGITDGAVCLIFGTGGVRCITAMQKSANRSSVQCPMGYCVFWVGSALVGGAREGLTTETGISETACAQFACQWAYSPVIGSRGCQMFLWIGSPANGARLPCLVVVWAFASLGPWHIIEPLWEKPHCIQTNLGRELQLNALQAVSLFGLGERRYLAPQ